MKKIVKKTSEKYVTEKTFKTKFDNFDAKFERSMQAIAKSFADNAEVMALILKEIRDIHEGNKHFRESMSSLYGDVFSHDKRIDNLDVRVEKLESKVK
ncbi:hypothetical protein A3A05_02580 [Candidatus Nomurabacteria bacterium RIFCSPLOWO2_01_FULL_41_12]|uniref:Uncharacterized protein n=1 Tax=Candidatus Nomurabacteria bacterium RIFCSPLOWO2_01_FULL_41_12 TaxID=1801774 RepID=A0A1F6WW38_9BACT|nr:MAG: hypothetical protein A2732_00690 [Candidatus Nomurabacteria bacterium RIFCSPHIGHO2_01_FULL_40_10]OGI85975.1 MAG: hypothetical protein A3A05_02580 [Candidatus Nomurabacteria bacterium RIFCSPLOWO2_01_FULL_41_12]